MRRVFSSVLAAAVAAGLASPAAAKVLTFCAAGGAEGFDPAAYVTGATFDASAQTIYDRLVAFEPGTLMPVPGLAESWQVSEDGLEYTFRLREGVAFQTTIDFRPTRALNADDVIFSFARQMDADHPFHDYLGRPWGYFTGLSLDHLIRSLEKVDERTVKFVLARPDAGFVASLAMDFASILSKEYADSLGRERRALLDARPIGTGPFQLVTYRPDERINYRAHPEYWGGRQPIGDLVFLIEPDPARRLDMLKAGACQAMADPDAAALAAARADPTLAVTEADRADIAYLAFNTTQEPFNDARVRRALAMAIDKQAIVDSVYGELASAADGLVPPGLWSHDDAVGGNEHDPVAARALLAEAGVEGLTMTLWVSSTRRPYNPDPVKVAGMIATDLAGIGVEVAVEPLELGEFLRQSADPGRDGAALFGWTSDNGDPDGIIGVLLSCDAVGISNRAAWCDQPFEDLLRTARATADRNERRRLYADAQRIVVEQAPLVPLVHTVSAVPMSRRVTGLGADPLGRHRFVGVDVGE
jgi:dipeptide transport system substrate-binding protein